jgi:hypothetical protein
LGLQLYPTPNMGVHLGVWVFTPSHSLHSWEHVMWLPGLLLGPPPCNPLALVASQRLRLRQLHKPRQGACKGASQEGSLGVTSHATGSVGECERMNPHTPKWTPTLGVRILMDSRIFKKWSQGSKHIGLRSFLYHWKALGT